MRVIVSSSASTMRVSDIGSWGLLRFGYPLGEGHDGMRALPIRQLEFALEVFANQAAHDLQAQTALVRGVETMRQATAVVVDLDVQTIALLCQTYDDRPTGQSDERVLDGILHQLVDDQRTGRRLLSGQGECPRALECEVDRPGVVQHAVAHLGQDAVRDLVNIDDAG